MLIALSSILFFKNELHQCFPTRPVECPNRCVNQNSTAPAFYRLVHSEIELSSAVPVSLNSARRYQNAGTGSSIRSILQIIDTVYKYSCRRVMNGRTSRAAATPMLVLGQVCPLLMSMNGLQ